MCEHQNIVEHRNRIRPPRTVGFVIRYSVCTDCGVESCSPKQRQKNRKQYRYSENRYRRTVPPVDICAPTNGLW